MKHVGKQFTAKKIDLDGNQYEGCTFLECQLVYSGGKVGLVNCTIARCRFTLADKALGVLQSDVPPYDRPGAEHDELGRIRDELAVLRAGPQTPA